MPTSALSEATVDEVVAEHGQPETVADSEATAAVVMAAESKPPGDTSGALPEALARQDGTAGVERSSNEKRLEFLSAREAAL